MFAQLVLILFVPISLIVLWKWRPSLSVTGVLLGAALFLPEKAGFDLPGMPAFNKQTAPIFCILLASILFLRRGFLRLRLKSLPTVITLIFVIASLGTTLTNGDGVIIYDFQTGGDAVLPPLRFWDMASMMTYDLLLLLLPFAFGTMFFRTARDVKDLFRVTLIFALIYLPLIILEVALSPQFHAWVYGYHPKPFYMTYRFGGYKPSVFMATGLTVGLYVSSAALISLGLGRLRTTIRGIPTSILSLPLGVTLFFIKSLAAICYFLTIMPIVLFLSPRAHFRTAIILATLIIAYPALRITGLFPTQQLVALAASVEMRAQSIQFRFNNEDILIDRAVERSAFGWGGFGRSQVYYGGRDASVTDGFWIIRFGERGVIGFLATFALLLLPVFAMARRLRDCPGKKEQILAGVLALVLAVYSLDLLPNGLFMPFPFLLSGALLGFSQGLALQRTTVRQPLVSGVPKYRRYTPPS